jgi:hypothetical protein
MDMKFRLSVSTPEQFDFDELQQAWISLIQTEIWGEESQIVSRNMGMNANERHDVRFCNVIHLEP